MDRDECGIWGVASFGTAYCNAKPGHTNGHYYKAASGVVYPLTFDIRGDGASKWFIVEAGLMGPHSMGIDSHTAEALASILEACQHPQGGREAYDVGRVVCRRCGNVLRERWASPSEVEEN